MAVSAIRQMLSWRGETARVALFVLAILVYGLLGSPTPDNPGVIELLIAVLLMAGVGVSATLRAIRIDVTAPLWFSGGQILLFYGLSVPLLMAAVHAHGFVAVMRDVFPFIFMLLPVFMAETLSDRREYFKAALIGVLILGALFSVRAVLQIYDYPFLFFVARAQGGELTYHANMPSVLFAALFLAGWSARAYIYRLTSRNLLQFILCVAGAVLILLPVALTMQRASLGYVVFYALVLLVTGMIRYPYRVFPVLGMALFVLILFGGDVARVADALFQKTSLVGFNMRFQELAAVWRDVSSSPVRLLFGAGWGAHFESPAVGGLSVNFTHSLLSSFILKTGLCGVILVILYLFGLARVLWDLSARNLLLSLALAGPIIIDVFLYGSYKSLDFGLILLLTAAAAGLKDRDGLSCIETRPVVFNR